MAGISMPTMLPTDVRLMNGVSGAVFVIAGVVLAAASVAWLARSTLFPIRSIHLEGDLHRNSVTTIRANTTPRLAGNFFSFDLARARTTFEAVPWVRRAVVRRVWPDSVAVRLEEHQAVARWEDEQGNEKIVNSFGEVFDANVGDVEDEELPLLAGPSGSSGQMLAMLNRLMPVLKQIDHDVLELRLSTRGSWRVELDEDVTVELGRGSDDEVFARTERFAQTLAQVTNHFKSPLLHADLRHAEGYAVRLRGVTTTTTTAAASAAKGGN
jgi:cell division protein FtsQ